LFGIESTAFQRANAGMKDKIRFKLIGQEALHVDILPDSCSRVQELSAG
jgi:hypothetical protein